MNDNRRQFIKKSLSCSIFGFFAPYLAKSQTREIPKGIYSYIFDDYYWMKYLNDRPAKLLMCRNYRANSDMILNFTHSWFNPSILMWEEKFRRNTFNINTKIIDVAILEKKVKYNEIYNITSYLYPIKVEFEVL